MSLFCRVIGGPERRQDIGRLACVRSENGRLYPLIVLTTYAGKFEGAPVYVHHSDLRDFDGPGLLGWISGVTFARRDSSLLAEIEPVGGREQDLVSDHAGQGWGVSWEGSYQSKPRRGIEVVTAITEVLSVDLTPHPAAGGAFLTQEKFNYLRGDNQNERFSKTTRGVPSKARRATPRAAAP